MSTKVFDHSTRFYFRLTIEDNLNVFGIDVYPSRCDDDFFLTSPKIKVALPVHLTNVSGAKPFHLSGCCLSAVAPVSRRNIFAPHEDFAVFGQLQLLSAQNTANRTASEFEWMIYADQTRGFGHTVAL